MLEFICIVFCEFRGMNTSEIEKRVKFKPRFLDESKKYLLKAERKKAKEAEKERERARQNEQ